MLKRISHVSYAVSDMQNSLHFYQNVLGLEKAFEYQRQAKYEGCDPTTVCLRINESQFIELYQGRENVAKSETTIGYSHICIEVDDILKTVELLKNKNIVLSKELRTGADGNYQCWVEDPDGNPIELLQGTLGAGFTNTE